MLVTEDYFRVFALRAARGRVLEPSDFAGGAAQAIVIGDRMWRVQFASDPAIIGREVRLDDRPVTIVGVLRPEVRFAELFAPLMTPAPPVDRGARDLFVFARLAAGVSRQQAADDRAGGGRTAGRGASGHECRLDDQHRPGAGRVPRAERAHRVRDHVGRSRCGTAHRLRQCRRSRVVAIVAPRARDRGSCRPRRQPRPDRPAVDDGAHGHCLRWRRRGRRPRWMGAHGVARDDGGRHGDRR